MSDRLSALGAGAIAIAAVIAQLVAPAWTGFHTWQYAGLLALAAIVIVGDLFAIRSDPSARGAAIALAGALIVTIAGVASGLLGPDSIEVVRAPGTVAPLPDLGVAAFFPSADPQSIGSGDVGIALRGRDGSTQNLALGARAYRGSSTIEVRPHLAVFMEAHDASGRRLTITQPTGSAFLSPVLLFGSTVTIGGASRPADGFATPAIGRNVKVIYFDHPPSAHAQGLDANVPVVLFAVDDDRTQQLVPGGIAIGPNGREVSVGGLRLRATIGTYPELRVSSAPYPAALWFGTAAFVAGLVWMLAGNRIGPLPARRIASASSD